MIRLRITLDGLSDNMSEDGCWVKQVQESLFRVTRWVKQVQGTLSEDVSQVEQV